MEERWKMGGYRFWITLAEQEDQCSLSGSTASLLVVQEAPAYHYWGVQWICLWVAYS